MFRRRHVLSQPVPATAVDDDGHSRFPRDTMLPEGAELRIISGPLPWRERPETELYYTVEAFGSRYRVDAGALDEALASSAAR